MRATLIAVVLLCVGNLFAQQDTTQTTFHIKSEHIEKFAVSIVYNMWNTDDTVSVYKALYIDEKNSIDVIWGDSLIQHDTSFSDAALANAVRTLVTFQFIDDLKKCDGDSEFNYYEGYDVGIYNNGIPNYDVTIYGGSIKKFPCLSAKFYPVIKILNEVYKKYGKPF